MASVSARAVDFDRRTDERTRIARSAVLRLGDVSHGIRVEDLTRDGCKITTNLDLEIGSTAILGFAGVGRHLAQVVWRDGDTYGCIFDEPLRPGAVTAATRNNVDHFAGPDALIQPVTVSDVKLPPRTRALVIFGAAAALWVTAGAFALAIAYI